jgi:hypothetical protein
VTVHRRLRPLRRNYSDCSTPPSTSISLCVAAPSRKTGPFGRYTRFYQHQMLVLVRNLVNLAERGTGGRR